jgi:superfamily I DNA and/or RNA helicase
MLRTQYRCHPQFSALSSKHFYGGVLKDGIIPAQRPSLVPPLPALVFFDCVRLCTVLVCCAR